MENKQNKKEEKTIRKFPLRIDESLYEKIESLVYKKKQNKENIENRKYSMNKYIIESIERNLKEGSSNE